MLQRTLLLTVGLPKSGKSSWARKSGYPMVNPDAIRFALYGDSFIYEAEKMVWAIAHYMVRSLFEAGHDTVVLDATNTTKKRRDPWKSDLWIRKYKIFNASADECIRRAEADDRRDLLPVIERMDGNYEEVGSGEWDEEY